MLIVIQILLMFLGALFSISAYGSKSDKERDSYIIACIAMFALLVVLQLPILK